MLAPKALRDPTRLPSAMVVELVLLSLGRGGGGHHRLERVEVVGRHTLVSAANF